MSRPLLSLFKVDGLLTIWSLANISAYFRCASLLRIRRLCKVAHSHFGEYTQRPFRLFAAALWSDVAFSSALLLTRRSLRPSAFM